eukprot:g2728.t1
MEATQKRIFGEEERAKLMALHSQEKKENGDKEKRKKEGRPTKTDPRSRNLFGKLLGHLHSAKDRLQKEKTSKMGQLQSKALSRVEEKVNLSRMNIKEFRKGEFEKQLVEEQAKVAEIEKQLEEKEVLLLQRRNHYSLMMNFIRTEVQPPIFFLPAKHTRDTEKMLDATRAGIKKKIATLRMQFKQEQAAAAEAEGGRGEAAEERGEAAEAEEKPKEAAGLDGQLLRLKCEDPDATPRESSCLLTRLSGVRSSSKGPQLPEEVPPKVAFPAEELPGAIAEADKEQEQLTAVMPLESPRSCGTSVSGEWRTKTQIQRKKIIKSQDEHSTYQSWTQRVVYSSCYELYSALLILLNAIFEYAASTVRQPASQDGFEPTFFFVAQIVFFLAFFMDLALRWVADGLIYFVCNEEMYWNVLDIFVSAVLMTNFTVVRMIRVLRVVRIARVIRVLKAFRELRLMVASIVSSARNLLWVIMILCVLLYVFGISFTSAVALELEMSPPDAEGTEELKRYFGSLSSSILTLYSSMTLFLFFVTFAVFAVVNVVTGVFVDTAIEKNQTDKELAIQEELRSKKLRMNWIRDVFGELDSSGDGTVTLKEFEQQLNHEAVIAYFNTLKLDVSDARTLFRLLDRSSAERTPRGLEAGGVADGDGSDGVNIDEFVQGCYRLSGEATTLHTQVMQCDIKDMLIKMGHIMEILEDLRSRRRSSRHSRGGSAFSDLHNTGMERLSERSSRESGCVVPPVW